MRPEDPKAPGEDQQRRRRSGRPAGSGNKEVTTLRLDRDVLAAFRASGNGWQTRINALLREAMEEGRLQ